MQGGQGPQAYFGFEVGGPDRAEEGRQHWYAPAANFVIDAVSVEPGAVLDVEDNPDESMLVLSNDSATVRVTAGSQSEELGGRSLVILPPGRSRCEALTAGRVYRVFSQRSPEYQRALALVGEPDRGGVPPFKPWPEPPGGYRLRAYRLSAYAHIQGRRRVFRSTNLMVAMGETRMEPRPADDLSPHSHDDFQQVSLVTEGKYLHHLRRPWGRDATKWVEDVHIEADVPSVAVIPVADVHTSQNIGEGPWHLIDVFGPPRRDFAEKGYVLNEDDYPLPTFDEDLTTASSAGER